MRQRDVLAVPELAAVRPLLHVQGEFKAIPVEVVEVDRPGSAALQGPDARSRGPGTLDRPGDTDSETALVPGT